MVLHGTNEYFARTRQHEHGISSCSTQGTGHTWDEAMCRFCGCVLVLVLVVLVLVLVLVVLVMLVLSCSCSCPLALMARARAQARRRLSNGGSGAEEPAVPAPSAGHMVGRSPRLAVPRARCRCLDALGLWAPRGVCQLAPSAALRCLLVPLATGRCSTARGSPPALTGGRCGQSQLLVRAKPSPASNLAAATRPGPARGRWLRPLTRGGMWAPCDVAAQPSPAPLFLTSPTRGAAKKEQAEAGGRACLALGPRSEWWEKRGEKLLACFPPLCTCPACLANISSLPASLPVSVGSLSWPPPAASALCCLPAAAAASARRYEHGHDEYRAPCSHARRPVLRPVPLENQPRARPAPVPRLSCACPAPCAAPSPSSARSFARLCRPRVSPASRRQLVATRSPKAAASGDPGLARRDSSPLFALHRGPSSRRPHRVGLECLIPWRPAVVCRTRKCSSASRPPTTAKIVRPSNRCAYSSLKAQGRPREARRRRRRRPCSPGRPFRSPPAPRALQPRCPFPMTTTSANPRLRGRMDPLITTQPLASTPAKPRRSPGWLRGGAPRQRSSTHPRAPMPMRVSSRGLRGSSCGLGLVLPTRAIRASRRRRTTLLPELRRARAHPTARSSP